MKNIVLYINKKLNVKYFLAYLDVGDKWNGVKRVEPW